MLVLHISYCKNEWVHSCYTKPVIYWYLRAYILTFRFIVNNISTPSTNLLSCKARPDVIKSSVQSIAQMVPLIYLPSDNFFPEFREIRKSLQGFYRKSYFVAIQELHYMCLDKWRRLPAVYHIMVKINIQKWVPWSVMSNVHYKSANVNDAI